MFGLIARKQGRIQLKKGCSKSQPVPKKGKSALRTSVKAVEIRKEVEKGCIADLA